MRQRCYECFRPTALCFCDQIPQVDNRTEVLILQHVGERFHPFNTARIVDKALKRCELIVDHNRRFSQHRLPIKDGAGLLYPHDNAPTLSELSPAERPQQLVILDGTWHQAKTIYRDTPALRALPCFRLQPAEPGQYRIRREPSETSLSTLEATVAALAANEPETAGLDQMLAAFKTMVDAQLAHPASRNAWRRKKSRDTKPRYLPPALLKSPQRLVVAYGEALPREMLQSGEQLRPVSWKARRLGTNDRFASCMASPELSSDVLRYLRLTAEDITSSVCHDEFACRWQQFLRPDDILVVYHARTYQLVKDVAPRIAQCLVLKSIYGRWQSGFQSVEELMVREGVTLPDGEHRTRADQRLAATVALTEHLRNQAVAFRPA